MVSDGWRGIGVAFAVPPRVGERSRHKHTRGGGDAHQRVSATPGAAGRVRASCREPSRDCAVRRVGCAQQRSAGTGWTALQEFPMTDPGRCPHRDRIREPSLERDGAHCRAPCMTRPGPRSVRCRRDCPMVSRTCRQCGVAIAASVQHGPDLVQCHERPRMHDRTPALRTRRAGSSSARERMKFVVHGGRNPLINLRRRTGPMMSANAFVHLIGKQPGISTISDVFAGVSHCLVIRIFT